ncbi:hypothetical protein H9P43_000233 [Blastocladiella emersonii ATCC 22665]|nr:hypothetical protein H9P43_000233 [Blastocladiella emersonii ATCC 22665]
MASTDPDADYGSTSPRLTIDDDDHGFSSSSRVPAVYSSSGADFSAPPRRPMSPSAMALARNRTLNILHSVLTRAGILDTSSSASESSSDGSVGPTPPTVEDLLIVAQLGYELLQEKEVAEGKWLAAAEREHLLEQRLNDSESARNLLERQLDLTARASSSQMGEQDVLIEDLRRETRRQADEVRHWHAECEALHAQLASATSHAADLEADAAQLRRAERDLAGLAARAAKAEAELEVMGDENAALKSELAKQRSYVTHERSAMEAVMRREHEAEQQLALENEILKAKIREAEAREFEHRRRIDELARDLDEYDALLRAAREELQFLEEERSSTRSDAGTGPGGEDLSFVSELERLGATPDDAFHAPFTFDTCDAGVQTDDSALADRAAAAAAGLFGSDVAAEGEVEDLASDDDEEPSSANLGLRMLGAEHRRHLTPPSQTVLTSAYARSPTSPVAWPITGNLRARLAERAAMHAAAGEKVSPWSRWKLKAKAAVSPAATTAAARPPRGTPAGLYGASDDDGLSLSFLSALSARAVPVAPSSVASSAASASSAGADEAGARVLAAVDGNDPSVLASLVASPPTSPTSAGGGYEEDEGDVQGMGALAAAAAARASRRGSRTNSESTDSGIANVATRRFSMVRNMLLAVDAMKQRASPGAAPHDPLPPIKQDLGPYPEHSMPANMSLLHWRLLASPHLAGAKGYMGEVLALRGTGNARLAAAERRGSRSRSRAAGDAAHSESRRSLSRSIDATLAHRSRKQRWAAAAAVPEEPLSSPEPRPPTDLSRAGLAPSTPSSSSDFTPAPAGLFSGIAGGSVVMRTSLLAREALAPPAPAPRGRPPTRSSPLARGGGESGGSPGRKARASIERADSGAEIGVE